MVSLNALFSNRIMKFLSCITACLVFTFGAIGESRADPTFTLTTTSDTTSFDFSLSAAGTFTVDCGDGGTLTSSVDPTDVSGNTITRSGTTAATYTCTWGSAGAHTIGFSGEATDYSTGTSTAAISFYAGSSAAANVAKIASISGNLSTIFPYKTGNAANGAQPRFYSTFGYATNLTSIPATLFADYTTASTWMFDQTFRGCTGLTSAGIPSNLFFPNAQSVSGTGSMFGGTFYGCTGLTTIPENLFSKITSGAKSMFSQTFVGCTGLTSAGIPSNLFFPNAQSVSGASNMFYQTFYNCTGLTYIPENLFSKITSGASYMFSDTFRDCFNLGCATKGCSTGTGYISPTLFAGITPRGSNSTDTMNNTFYRTKLVTTCPTGTTQYTTGWESYWYGNKVSCIPNVPSHSITYVMDGGTNYNGAPETYKEGTGATIDGIPTKSGYVFAGWCIDDQLQSCAMSQTIGTSATTDQIFYAKWTQCQACAATNASCTLSVVNNTCTYTTSCNSGYGNIQNNGAYNASCSEISYPFTLTTTSGQTSFQFSLSAVGTFTVDCGDGGTLTSSASDVSGNTITRSGTTAATYTCTWGSAGAHTIGFSGTATNYVTGTQQRTAAISFFAGSSAAANAAKIASISGNLSAIFPYKTGNAAEGAQPGFRATFYGATNLTSIPATLFADYTTASTEMFTITFKNCTGLTSAGIPSNLFFPNAQSVSGVSRLFEGTFSGCTGLTTLPSDLFSKITSGAQYMFYSTFYGCTGLTSAGIPSNLFFPNVQSVSGASRMFAETFSGCTGLTSIPENLFSKITSGAYNMFQYTFYGCTNLGCATKGCSTGTGYIPSNLFAGITPRGSNSTDTMAQTFYDTKLVTTCPAGTTQYTTGWESYWGGNKVSCIPLVSHNITYVMDGGTNYNGAPETYGEGVGATIDGIPTKSGYVFAGWCIDDQLQSCAMSQTISTSATTDQIFYAKWTQCTACSGNTNASCELSVVNNTCTYTTSCNNANSTITNNGQYNAYCTACTACDATNASCSLSVVNNTCTYTTACNDGYGDIQNKGEYNASCSACEPCDATNASCSVNTVNNVCTYTTACNEGYGAIQNEGAYNVSCSEVDTYNVTYACGDGATGTAPTDSNDYESGTSVTTLANTCSKTGNTFTGWSCGGTNVNAGSTFTISGNTTCTAQWSACQACSGNTGASCSLSVVNNTCTYTTSCNNANSTITNNGQYNAYCTACQACAGNTGVSCSLSVVNNVCTYTTACNEGYGDIQNKGEYNASCSEMSYPFTITTTSTNSFSFVLYAAGTFTVDCGAGGSLSGISGNTITRSGTSGTTYTCNWSSSGAHTIGFGGTATNYGTDANYGAISFYHANSSSKIASISGNISRIFPYIDGNSVTGAQPRFSHTFREATNLTSIPATLFADYTTASAFMFYHTFKSCTGLVDVPSNLFFPNAQSVAGARGTFAALFGDCTSLTSVPENLFSKVTTGGDEMFRYTFHNCTGLTSIPANLFGSITSVAYHMFENTFYGCTNLGCKTAGCSTGTGYIPATLFAGITPRGSNSTNTMNNTFYNTKLVTTCPANTTQYTTGWEGSSTWNSKVSCIPNAPSHNITYVMDGGTNYNNAPATYREGTGATIDGIPTKSGYVFAGWCIDDQLQSCAMTQTISTSATTDQIFYAKWTQCTACDATNATCSLSVVNNTCTYTTSCNSGYGNIQNNGAYNASCSACTPCDATNASCSVNTVNNVCTYTTACNEGYGAIQNEGAYNVSCSRVDFYNVTYACGDGATGTAPTDSNDYESGTSVTTLANTCSKTGNTFTGWSCGGTNVNAGSTFTISENTTCTAQWSACQACSGNTGASCSLSVVNNACTYTTSCNNANSTITNNGQYNAYCTACQACAGNTGVSCSLSVSNNTCTYATSCNTGYSNITGNGTANASCSANVYDITYDLTGGEACLPSEYEQIEYLQSSGTQYIITGQNFLWGDEFFFEYSPVSSYSNENKGYGGGTYNWDGITGGGRNKNETNKPIAMFFQSGHRLYSPTLYFNDTLGRHYTEHWKIDTSTGYLDSTLTDLDSGNTYTLSAGGFTSSYNSNRNVYLFRDSRTDYPLPAATRIYGTWLKRNNGNLAFNFIPARRKSDNVLGMYDTVSGTFKTNSGSGSFSAGNVVNGVTCGTNYSGAPTTYTYGVGATINGTPTREGYTFAGWCTNSNLTSCANSQTIATTDTGDKTFYAKWTEATSTYSVTYECGTGATGTAPTDSTDYISGASVTTLANTCSKTGNTFAGWSCGGTNVNAGSTFTISENTTCTAQWSVCDACSGNTNATCELSVVNNTCTYTTACNETSVNIQHNGEYNASCSACTPCDATNASCSLSVVNDTCTYTTSCNTGYGNPQHENQYNVSCSANTYIISYDNMTGATNYNGAPTTYTYGAGATVNGAPTKSGYTFAGWCTDAQLENCASSQTVATDATGDKTFYAKWCNDCGATNANCILSTAGNVCSYTTVCNLGYGNIQNNGAYNASCTANTISITWNGALQSDIETNEAGTTTYGGDIRTPVKPDPAQIPVGYRFKGWKFVKNKYHVTYACGNGTNGEAPTDSTGYELNASVTTVTTANNTCTKSGNTFTGWSCGGTNVNAGSTFTISDDTTCTAQWSACNACAATNASCTLSVVNNVCTYTTACNSGYENIQNNGAYNASCSAPQTTFDLTTITGTNLTNNGKAYGSMSHDGTGNNNQSTYGLTDAGTWGVTLADGSTKVRGDALCSTDGSGLSRGDTGTPNESGSDQYCWCKATGYQASGESTWMDVSPLSWVFHNGYGSALACATSCAGACGNLVQSNAAFRRAVFGVSGN